MCLFAKVNVVHRNIHLCLNFIRVFYVLTSHVHGLRSTILIIDADSLLTETTILTALAFKGNHASAFGYLAKVFSTVTFELYCSNSISGNT